jgi:uncharacterized membrane protein
MRDQAVWPEREVLRLEGFSDAVFAFALTLLVVSLEVPKSFDELLHMLRAAPAFAVCFVLFSVIWTAHHRFFRRYAFVDVTILTLNAVLLFLVLLYVYPLKFLFTLLLGGEGTIRPEQGPLLMVIYSTGYAAVWATFALMYEHVNRQRARLELTPVQMFETRAQLGSCLIHMSFGIVSVLLALLLPNFLSWAGWTYGLIGPSQWLFWSQVAKRRRHIAKRRERIVGA